MSFDFAQPIPRQDKFTSKLVLSLSKDGADRIRTDDLLIANEVL